MKFRAERWLAAGLLAAASTTLAQVTSCTAAGASMNLGPYDSFQAIHADSSLVFTVNCSRSGGPGDQTVTIGLGPSTHSGSIASRRLKLATGSDLAIYNVYRDAGRNLVWGTATGATMSLTQFIKNNTTVPFTFTLFGRIDALQDLRPGTYGDSLTITVTF